VEALESDREGQVPEAVLFALMHIMDASALPALRAELKQETSSERRRVLENVIGRIEESAWGDPVNKNMNARDVLETFIEYLVAGKYEEASRFARRTVMNEGFRRKVEKLSGREDLRINYITADSRSALGSSSGVEAGAGPEDRLVFLMINEDEMWRIVSIDLSSGPKLARIVDEFLDKRRDNSTCQQVS
jgi:hypothetical protein